MQIPSGDLDILVIGEALIDLISVGEADTLSAAQTFERFQGGSPANIAANVAKLGGRAAIIAKTGADAFGQFIKAELEKAGVVTDYLLNDPLVHTSLVFVARSKGTPDFDVFRDGDARLTPEDIAEEAIQRARIVHASTWPLSRQPARSAVEKTFQIAREGGRLISLDPNYSPKIWPDRQEAQEVLAQMMQYVTVTKPSLDDAQRLFGAGQTPEQYIARFHAMGPSIVVFTMGAEGLLLSVDGVITHIPARPVKVVDVTGAGDAFWSGFLVALLDGNTLPVCAAFAREIVGLKLSTIGPLPGHIDRQKIYELLM
ncbi:MAG: carbohydrate kinase [Anaerolineae bacterium]|nr:carbohydrate kinase [Anaerolineae bacterium]